MKAYLKQRDGFSMWITIKDHIPVISIPITTNTSLSPSDYKRDFFLERQFLNEDEEIVCIYKER